MKVPQFKLGLTERERPFQENREVSGSLPGENTCAYSENIKNFA
jgi:hypothetical protein